MNKIKYLLLLALLIFTGCSQQTGSQLGATPVLTIAQGGTGSSSPYLVPFSYASSTFPTFTYASSTYYLASNPNGYVGPSSLAAYLTTTTAASTYYLASNPSEFITSSALTPYLTTSTAASTYLTQASSSATYYLLSNPSGFITNSDLAPYLSTTSASATYITQASTSATYALATHVHALYLSTTTAASTYMTYDYGSSTLAHWLTSGDKVYLASSTKYVGIGTSSPYDKLEVWGSDTRTGTSTNTNYVSMKTSTNGELGFYVNRTIGTYLSGWTWYIPSTSTDFRLFSDSKGDVMSFNYTTGNIGIGTTTSANPLSVIGKIWSTIAQFTTQLFIPSSATLSTQSAGEIGIDTTSNQLRYFGTATSTISPILTPSFTIASTTLTGGAATTTIPLGYAGYDETWLSVICGTDVGTSTLRFGDGTNYTNTITAIVNPSSATLSSNNVFVAAEKRQIQIVTTTGTPNYITCTINKTINPD